MGSRVLMLLALAVLASGYLVYGRLVARILGVDPARKTPAHTRRDGVDYVPAKHWLVLFGHHFSSICAAGPIVGPALAVAYWGWMPALAWILVGGVLMGAVADFSALVISVRHEGISISEVSGQVISPRARVLFSSFILISLVLVLGVFAELTAGTFVKKPEIVAPSLGILPVAVLVGLLLYRGAHGRLRLAWVTVAGLGALAALMVAGSSIPLELPALGACSPQQLWVLLLLLYCFVASVIPVQKLLQPRDYLSSYVLFTTIGLGVAGVLLGNPSMNARSTNGAVPVDWPGAGPLWPMLFVVIACGAISGFHSVVSSGTTCKQLDNEAHACRVAYGAMLTESLVAVLVLIAVGAGLSATRHAELIQQPGGAITAFGEGYQSLAGIFLGDYGAAFAIMALNFFMLTTLDTATRLGRYLLAELTGIENRYLPTALVVLAGGALALSGQWRAVWPAFGASNQLVASLALLVVSCWLLGRGRPVLPTLVPSLLMLLTTIGAFGYQIYTSLTVSVDGQWKPNYFIAGVDLLLLVLAALVLLEAWPVLKSLRSGPVRKV